MTKRTERGQRRQAENEAGPGLAPLVEPMLAGMTATRQHLLAWVHAQGLAALDELFREEAVALAGSKGRHQPERTHHHWGRRRRSSPSGAGACRCAAPGCGRRPVGKRRCPRWRRFATGTR
jgi:hypothetical protein